MSDRHENPFPATSIGRSPLPTGNIARTASRESLSPHPLLSNAITDPAPARPASPKYAPYMSRQRPASTTAPVQSGASAAPQLPQTQGGAVSKLQTVNLKAAAQGIGLDTGSIGWAILEKISYEGDTTEEWAEIWNAITKNKASLLLPLEQLTGQDKITPEFIQDHTVVYNTMSRDDTPIITLSGLRGQLVNDVLTLRSTLTPSTKQFHELFESTSSRTSLLNALPPLPFYSPESSYPRFSVPSYTTSLPLPPRPSKPPLPPRPFTRLASAQPLSRPALTFTTLFGQRQSTGPSTTPASTPSASVPVSSASLSTTSADIDTPIEISALTISASISRQNVATEIVAALQGEIAMSLDDQPPWLLERAQTFASPLFPFIKASTVKKKLQDLGGSPGRIKYIVNNTRIGTLGELSEKFQDFYRVIEAELRNDERKGVVRTEHESENERQMQASKQDAEEKDARIRDVLETVEATLCSLFYDRIFLPAGSDDTSHDEALSSRIAALNMLDLGLEHLDVDVGSASHGQLDAVVRACGETLTQLDLASRTPRNKATVLVSAHKIVVEALSKIPPLRLKGDDSLHEASVPPALPSVPPEPIEPIIASQMFVSSPTDVASAHRSAPPKKQESALSEPHTSPGLPVLSRPPSELTTAASIVTTPVSGDILLPFLIFSVVKANPPRLVSHLLFTQRFRNQSFRGEEEYCLINLMAVAEFLENVDLGALALREGEKVINTADLTPIPIVRTTHESPETTNVPYGTPSSFRGRVGQGVDAIAGSANKVISGVFDTSFGVLRALIPGQSSGSAGPAMEPVAIGSEGPSTSLSPPAGSAALGGTGTRLLRRESGFSIASLAASLPGGQGTRSRAASNVGEAGQRELVDVSSRPRSSKSCSEDGGYVGDANEDSEDNREDGESEGVEDGVDQEVHDARSVQSFENMMSNSRKNQRRTAAAGSTSGRKSLTDRLSRLSMLSHQEGSKANPVAKSSFMSLRLPPPNRRFLECAEDDIRVSEVGEMLREYRLLVEAVRAAGGFDE